MPRIVSFVLKKKKKKKNVLDGGYGLSADRPRRARTIVYVGHVIAEIQYQFGGWQSSQRVLNRRYLAFLDYSCQIELVRRLIT